MPHGRPAKLAQFGGVELLGLARSGQQNTLGGDSGDMVEQGQLQSFPGDFAGVDKVARAESLLLPSFEDRHHQRVSLDLFQRFSFDR